MSRSRSRLAADWFAKLRLNSSTQEVEHTDVEAVDAKADTAESTKADASAVYTKAQVEAKIVELAPATDISMKADTTYVDAQISTISLTPGPTGPQGPQGPQGATGAVGPGTFSFAGGVLTITS